MPPEGGDPLSYRGKRAVVVGCGSGMGAATASLVTRLGADVHGVDVVEPRVELPAFTPCDLRDPDSVRDAASAIEGPVDALFNCAGLPQSVNAPLDVMQVNFVGTRLLTELLVERMPAGSAVVSIASSAGFGYLDRLAETRELVSTPGFEEAVAWCESHPTAVGGGYRLSKEALIVWTMERGTELIDRGIRINCTSPGPTVTPMMPSFEADTGAEVVDVFTVPIRRRARPEEQAGPLAFLNSDAASYVNGHNLSVDGGFTGGVTVGRIDLAELFAKVRDR